MKDPKPASFANPANNRKASRIDAIYIEKGFTLGGIISYKIKQFSTNKRLIQKAFRRMIQSSPILWTRVISDANGHYIFKAMADSRDWPTIEILEDSETNELARKLALDYQHRMESKYRKSIELRKEIPCHAACCFGETMVSIVLVSPHHFLDGMALGCAIALKLVAYVRVPRTLWPFLDRLFMDSEVPTYDEMYLKSDFRQCLDQTDGSLLSHMLHADLFKFRTKVSGGASSRHTLGLHLNHQVMSNFRNSLRGTHTTVTCTFCALAIKLMFHLVDTLGSNIVARIPGDGRKAGQWGDKRDRRKIPTFGTFAFANLILVDTNSGKANDLATLSRVCRRQVRRAYSDVEYLKHLIQHGNKIETDYFCGVSSVRIPTKATRLGIAPASFDAFIDFGDAPRIWFYVMTIGPCTRITVDFNLPGLGTKDLHIAIKTVIQENKELQPLLNQLHALQ